MMDYYNGLQVSRIFDLTAPLGNGGVEGPVGEHEEM